MNDVAYSKGSPFEVQDTSELRRVLNLRRRNWEEEVTTNDLYKRMSRAFRVPSGQQELFTIQAAALADGHDQRGLCGFIPAGDGKTLVSYLLPAIIAGMQRPLLLVPAGLIEKTWEEFREYQRHWICHPDFMTRRRFDDAVLSYERLGWESGKEFLYARRPDIVIADEMHMVSSRDAARTKRLERFMIANPTTIFCGFTGSPTMRSIADYWHLMYWSLREKMPLPRIEAEMERWAEVLDERKVDPMNRREAGALLKFCRPEEITEPERTAPIGRTQQMPTFHSYDRLKIVRLAYQRRLRDSPGIIAAPDQVFELPLTVRRVRVEPSKAVEEHLYRLRKEKLTPNGEVVQRPWELWRVAREIACGFYYRWDPRPPKDWLNARNTWFWIVRQILFPDGIYYQKYAPLHLDTPADVALAVTGRRRKRISEEDALEIAEETGAAIEDVLAAEGTAERKPKIDDPQIVEAYQRWAAIRDSYRIRSFDLNNRPAKPGEGRVVAEWVDDTVLRYCLDWIARNGPGIVWTEHLAFGQRLAELAGTGFCAAKGADMRGVRIEKYEGRNVVASVKANCTGRNLQAWSRNLVVTAPPVGRIWEQLLARTHRKFQMADTVYYDWIASCVEQDEGFSQALADASYIEQTTGPKQRLLYAKAA